MMWSDTTCISSNFEERFVLKTVADHFISSGNSYPIFPEELRTIKSSVAGTTACDNTIHMEGGER